MSNLYLALVHYPVYNKSNEIVVTSITNLDIHDIARSCATFGVKRYFLVNKLKSQLDLLKKIKCFWNSDIAKSYNKHRVKALKVIDFAEDIESVKLKIKKTEGKPPIVITTTATGFDGQLKISELNKVRLSGCPVLLIFGTGNGLVGEFHKQADYVLEPIRGISDYNHLSVRSAVAIILDRLTSEK